MHMTNWVITQKVAFSTNAEVICKNLITRQSFTRIVQVAIDMHFIMYNDAFLHTAMLQLMFVELTTKKCIILRFYLRLIWTRAPAVIFFGQRLI